MEDYKVILLRIYLSRGLNYRAFTLYHTRTHAHTQTNKLLEYVIAKSSQSGKESAKRIK